MNSLAKLEALLFVAGDEGLSLRQLSDLTGMPPTGLQQSLQVLSDKYMKDSQSALALLESGKSYKLVTKEVYAELLSTYAKTPMNQSLSRAALEVLSIIAYKQPITRVEIDQIRGVNSSGAVSKLQVLGLIKEVGKLEVVGRPNLYATTDYFLDYLGINSLDEMIDVSDLDISEEDVSLFEES